MNKSYNYYYFLSQFSDEFKAKNIDRINNRFKEIYGTV